jgi:3-oxoacyl-[acyl-carrier protein] reductase
MSPRPVNRVALVTGSSRGIGREIALTLGRTGFDVAVNYLKEADEAAKCVQEIMRSGVKSAAFRADVRKAAGAEGLVREVVSAFGRIDVLVNNVGDFMMKDILDLDPDEWMGRFDSNLHGTFFCCRAAIPHMIQHKWGRIVNIGVANADSIGPVLNTTPYTIAKTGVLILTKTLAKKLGPLGITANCVSPGMINKGDLSREDTEHLAKSVPLRRLGKPSDIASAVRFLVSEEGSYITGANIVVSGGWLL